jgi:hypothetical protein
VETMLLATGLFCVIAGIVGGGLKGLGMEVPGISSFPRQLMLSGLGLVLLIACYLNRTRPPSPPSPQPSPNLQPSAPADSSVTYSPSKFDTSTAYSITVVRTDSGDSYHYAATFAVPTGYLFPVNQIAVYGYRMDGSTRINLPANTFPTILGPRAPGSAATVNFDLPKGDTDPSSGWEVHFCAGSGQGCDPSPNLLLGQP